LLKDYADSLGRLGTPRSFVQSSRELRDGMRIRNYSIRFAKKNLRLEIYEMPGGRLEAFLVRE